MFVLDALVPPGWFFPDEISRYTEDVLENLRQTGAVVPQIWPLEIANVLLVGARRQCITEAQTVQLVRFLGDLPIRVLADASITAMTPILALARQHGLSAYDSSYLDLAMREGLPLATQDDRLRGAAQQVGVPLVP